MCISKFERIDQPIHHPRKLFGDEADFVTYGARLFLKPPPSASYWMVPGTYENAPSETLGWSRP